MKTSQLNVNFLVKVRIMFCFNGLSNNELTNLSQSQQNVWKTIHFNQLPQMDSFVSVEKVYQSWLEKPLNSERDFTLFLF